MKSSARQDEPHLVIEQAGIQTTVQDVDGRLGYWGVGVPPSGAMDSLSLALANRIVGNDPSAAGLEFTVQGATIRFDIDTVISLGGAEMSAVIDGRPVPFWEVLPVLAGSVLSVGNLVGPGMRSYLGIRGGVDVPVVLGSRATFTLGGFGGHLGRELEAGDGLLVGALSTDLVPSAVEVSARPQIATDWSLRVMEGPHGDAEFLTPAAIEEFLAATWTVQSHAARTGVRLSGPAPEWARADGGEAGLHPSNIHDNGYAFAAVDFTGDTPVLLGPDGPSLGGFTCPFTIVAADRWKLGQLAPGNTVSFGLIDHEGAGELRRERRSTVRSLRHRGRPASPPRPPQVDGGLISRDGPSGDLPTVTFRRAGDEFLLVEFGSMTLDLRLRTRVHLLEQWLDKQAADGALGDGIVDLTAGIRSLLIHFDPGQLPVPELVTLVRQGIEDAPDLSTQVIAGRTVHLPLSWEDPATLEAIRRYSEVVRADAPWSPSNIEFIRRINGLDSVDDVHRIVFEAAYLVLGLGDVYLGAPVATPLDPRHRLVTTKYNPARTWTPQNAVGIGGAYLCVYGMEGPGGYQFVGRTVPVWYLDTPTPGPEPDTPWLLRRFDQLRFYEVSTSELGDLRAAAAKGELQLKIEDTPFSLAVYEEELRKNSQSIEEFRVEQQSAFAAERDRWRERGELV